MDTAGGHNEVVNIGARAGYAPVVQDPDPLRREPVEKRPDSFLAFRASFPGGGALWVVAHREDQPAQPRMSGSDPVSPLATAPFMLPSSRGSCDTRINNLEAGHVIARDVRNRPLRGLAVSLDHAAPIGSPCPGMRDTVRASK